MAKTAKRLQLQTAASATGNGQAFDVAGYDHGAIQVTGITIATVSFEGTVDGSTWYAVPLINSAGTYVSSATADGLFILNEFTSGYAQLRARISAYTSGTINVYSMVWE